MMKTLRWPLLAPMLGAGFGTQGQKASATDPTLPRKYLKNPLLPVGPDPWVEYRHGFYYYMNTTVQKYCLAIHRTST
jgi:hypothetical protein